MLVGFVAMSSDVPALGADPAVNFIFAYVEVSCRPIKKWVAPLFSFVFVFVGLFGA
jgi:hypothetical protein